MPNDNVSYFKMSQLNNLQTYHCALNILPTFAPRLYGQYDFEITTTGVVGMASLILVSAIGLLLLKLLPNANGDD